MLFRVQGLGIKSKTPENMLGLLWDVPLQACANPGKICGGTLKPEGLDLQTSKDKAPPAKFVPCHDSETGSLLRNLKMPSHNMGM